MMNDEDIKEYHDLDRLKTYSRKINVPMSKIIRTLITSYLDEKEQQLREEGK